MPQRVLQEELRQKRVLSSLHEETTLFTPLVPFFFAFFSDFYTQVVL
jgi:hypothetical protein